jgi:hypothetical protein
MNVEELVRTASKEQVILRFPNRKRAMATRITIYRARKRFRTYFPSENVEFEVKILPVNEDGSCDLVCQPELFGVQRLSPSDLRADNALALQKPVEGQLVSVLEEPKAPKGTDIIGASEAHDANQESALRKILKM